MADNGKSTAAEPDFEFVEVPAEDIFGKPHSGVSINFEHFGPGKHKVSKEKAGEIRRLLFNRHRGDLRVLQPNADKAMEEIMKKRPLGAPSFSGYGGN